MPLPNLSYILEEVNVNGQYKRVIFDLDASYFEDDNKENIGTDTNLLFKLTGNRQIRYIKNILSKENYNDIFADYNADAATVKQIPRNLKCKLRKSYFAGDESAIQSTYLMIVGAVGCYDYESRGFLRGIKKSEDAYVSKCFDENNIKEENMVPRKVKQVSALPRLASGKIDMTTLREKCNNERESNGYSDGSSPGC